MRRGDRFVDEAHERGVLDAGNGMGVSFGDFNNDGRLDLHVTNMSSTAGNRILGRLFPGATASSNVLKKLASGNSLFENVGGGRFREVTTEVAPFRRRLGLGRWLRRLRQRRPRGLLLAERLHLRQVDEGHLKPVLASGRDARQGEGERVAPHRPGQADVRPGLLVQRLRAGPPLPQPRQPEVRRHLGVLRHRLRHRRAGRGVRGLRQRRRPRRVQHHDPGPVAPALPQQRRPGRPLASRGPRGRAVARPRRVLVGRARAHVGGHAHQDEGWRERLHLAARPAPAVRPGEGRAGRLRRGHVAGRLGRGLRRAVRGGDDGAPRAGQGAGRGRATRLRAAARPADAGRGDRLRAARQGGPARPRPRGRRPRRPTHDAAAPREAGPAPARQRVGDVVRPLQEGDAGARGDEAPVSPSEASTSSG